MILIELETGAPKRLRLEFHPRVTVVAGLSSEQRQWLIESIVRAIATGKSDAIYNVDVNGEPQPLTGDLIARLGFARAPIDNVINPSDLPGAVIDGDYSGSHDDDVEDTSSTNEVKIPQLPELDDHIDPSSPLSQARAELREARIEMEEIERQLASDHPDGPIDDHEIAALRAEQEQAVRHVEELRAAIDDLIKLGPQLPAGERLRRARVVRQTLEGRLIDLKRDLRGPSVEPELVEELLAEAKQAAHYEQEHLEEVHTASSMLAAWDDLQRRLSKARGTSGAPKWLVDQTRDELEQSLARVNALKMQMAEGIAVGPQLERAQQQLSDAQAAWEELQSTQGEDPKQIEAHLRSLYERIIALLEVDPGVNNVRPALEQFMQVGGERRDPRDELAELLGEGGIQATATDAIEVAMVWLDKVRTSQARREKMQQELANIAINIKQMDDEIAELTVKVDEVDSQTEADIDYSRLANELELAERDASRATTLLNAANDRRARGQHSDQDAIQRLQYRLEEARASVAAAERKVDYFARLGALADSGGSDENYAFNDDQPTAWWEGDAPKLADRPLPVANDVPVDVSGVNAADLERFVLARAAGLRHVGRGEPVPLIINGAFDGLSAVDAQRLLDVLPRIGPIVQIVYLATDDFAERWAKRQPEAIAATVHLERA